MKTTKRRFEIFSFFDHTGISRHLEKMAGQGWMIEKMTNFSWVYRKTEPAAVHFAVSYYPKASEFDPEPSEEQKLFHEFCAHTGWELACTAAQMQIFFNRRKNPTPIETEPLLELEAIHASAKRSFLASNILLLLISLLNVAMFVSNLLGDPIDLLARPLGLFTGFAFTLLAILCTVELSCYFRWRKKAKFAAQYGEFLQSPSTAKFQKRILTALVIGMVYWAVNILCGNGLQRWVGILMCLYMPAMFFITYWIKNFLKQKKASRSLNRTLTFLASFGTAFVMISGILFVTLKASEYGFFSDKGEETYEHGNMTWVIHQDELPLTVEDLLDVDYDGYMKERRGESSLLLGRLTMRQTPRFDAANYAEIPTLEYTLVIVRVPALYDMCKQRMTYEQETLIPEEKMEYKAEDAAPWGAKEAYRLYHPEFGAQNQWLLSFDGLLTEIRFGDWEPDTRQRSIVGQKLAGVSPLKFVNF